MLALTRKVKESIIINGNIEITILDISEGKVKIGIEAPRNIEIHRKEVYEQIKASNQEATQVALEQLNKLKSIITPKQNIKSPKL